MIDAAAIEALRESESLSEARTSLESALTYNKGALALPHQFQVHDLERMMKNRRRFRGHFVTQSTKEFAGYVGLAADDNKDGIRVFVDQATMSAKAVLDFQDAEGKPGHCEHTASITVPRLAAYKAMLAVARGAPLSQQTVAEYMEDWRDIIQCFDQDGALGFGPSLAAIRKLTIESARKVESTEAQLSASKSTFESVKANADAPIPTELRVTLVPYNGLQSRTFSLRLSIVTANDKPSIVLRVQNQELHDEQMGEEFTALVSRQVAIEAGEGTVPVLMGTFDTK